MCIANTFASLISAVAALISIDPGHSFRGEYQLVRSYLLPDVCYAYLFFFMSYISERRPGTG